VSSELLLAIDAGTGSCRAVLFASDGRQVAVSQREWVHVEPEGVPGGQEFDVEVNWQLIVECIKEAMAHANARAQDIRAVSSTSMREGIVLYGKDGEELWACPNVDSRAGDEARQLVEEGLAEKIYRESGDWVSITSTARLLWLARHRRDIIDQVTSLGMLSDWILFRLSGEKSTEPSCGSSSGMFDLAKRTWSTSITNLVGLDANVLPAVVPSGTVVGKVSAEASRQTGLSPGTFVVAGGADTQLGLLGAGITPGEFTVVGGTFWQSAMLLNEPLIDPEMRLRTLCHVLDGQWMIEGIGFYCGMAMRWCRDAFWPTETARALEEGLDPYTLMESAAAACAPGSNGVLAIMSNLMNAKHWTHASPSFLQFDVTNPAGSGRGACVRALEEAAAYVARGHRDIIGSLTALPGDVIFTGGAAKGSLWPQLMADVLGAPVHVPAVIESSALGAAICAGTGVGIFSSLEENREQLRQWQRTFEPSRGAASTYDGLYDHWTRVYAKMLQLSDEGLLKPLWRAADA
jgi:autoinducer 2 (AI-2) kinase